MRLRDPRTWLLLFALAGNLAFFGVRDLPTSLRLVKFEREHLRGLDLERRRVEMYFPSPDKPERRDNYIGMRRYLEFMAKIRAETPADARVGLVGLPMESLTKFAHYHLYPRHPFAIDRRDVGRVVKGLRLDYVATLDERGGRVERAP